MIRKISYALVAWLFAACPVQANTAKENLLKAAFVYNFTKLIEWPEAESKFHICHFTQAEYSRALKKIEERSNARLAFSVTPGANGSHDCQLNVYDEAHPPKQLSTSRNLLTVGEGDEFVKRGGMISFVRKGAKIKFIINLRATQKAGLRVNPQLLEVAHEVVNR